MLLETAFLSVCAASQHWSQTGQQAATETKLKDLLKPYIILWQLILPQNKQKNAGIDKKKTSMFTDNNLCYIDATCSELRSRKRRRHCMQNIPLMNIYTHIYTESRDKYASTIIRHSDIPTAVSAIFILLILCHLCTLLTMLGSVLQV